MLTENEISYLAQHGIPSTDVASVNMELKLVTYTDGTTRQMCEVWTRVMGYHRPVAYFNKGKKAEFEQRVYFTERRCNND